MKTRARFRILCAAAVFVTLVPAAGLFAQAKEATVAAKKYLAAVEALQFKAAYDLLSPDDRAFQPLAKYQELNPVVLIKALRKADKNYFRYTIKDANVEGDVVQISVTTRDLVIPNQGDEEFPIAMFYFGMLKPEMQKNKQKVDDADQVFAAFKKLFADNGMKELPFASVTRVVTMLKVKNAWYVKKGWQEAALKAQQASQEAEYETEGWTWVHNAMIGQIPIERAINGVLELQKKAPENAKIAENLSSLAKAQKSMEMVEVTVAAPEGPPTGIIAFQVANKAEMSVYSLGLEYSILDYKGDLLSKRELQITSDKLDPASPDGCLPGYAGVTTLDTGDDGKDWKDHGWRDTEVKLITVGFQRKDQ